jgi:D-alanine-D-alanine ligase
MVKVAILFGGTSSEHEISCLSAGSVLKNIDRNKFSTLAIGIDQSGGFHYLPDDFPLEITVENGETKLPIVPESLPLIAGGLAEIECDLFFPVLHGPGGEDGEIQSAILNIGKKFVGSNPAASKLAMDKVAAKKAFAEAGLKVTPGTVITLATLNGLAELQSKLSFPVFVKPSRSGSSRGTHKVKSNAELLAAIQDALKYDDEVLIEQAINAREIEVGVLERNKELIISLPGEIKIDQRFEFYDFEAKYLDGATSVEIPAAISPQLIKLFQESAERAFQALGGNGFARVDFFLDRDDNEIYLNEINTIPGFTATSVYPKLMASVGITYQEVITSLIESAVNS